MTLGPTGGKAGSKTRATARRGRGFRSVGETGRERLGEVAARRGFAEPEVLLRWSEVVGERLSGLCEPVKVIYPRNGGLGATLLVRVEGARAPEVVHLAPRILERIHQFYGYRAINELKVTQTTGGASGGFAEAPAGYPGHKGRPHGARGEPSPPEPSPAAQARAAELTRGIENEALRAALTRMGAHVLSRGEAPEK